MEKKGDLYLLNNYDLNDGKSCDQEENENPLSNRDLTPDQWVQKFIKINSIDYCYKTDSLRREGEVMEWPTAIAEMRLAVYRNDVTGIRNYLRDALIVWKKKEALRFIRSLQDRLSYKGNDLDLVANWVEAITGRRDELDIVVMRHWFWLVKRKLFRKSVEQHMMVVLYGKTGSGKSVALEQLLHPLTEVTLSTSMSILNDSFGHRLFGRNYVMVFEELDAIRDVEVGRLKHIITSSTIEWRVMRSESTMSTRNNCTFIGSSNIELRDQINDPTSARRYWQLRGDDIDWDKINNFDYVALWRSVDENSECPILPYIDEIREVQERDIRRLDQIEEWLNFACEICGEDQDNPTSKELYDNFRNWCEWQGQKNYPGFQQFSRKIKVGLSSLGWGCQSRHSFKGTLWPLRIKEYK